LRQSIDLEYTGVPGLEQLPLDRGAAIRVRLETRQLLDADAGTKKELHAGSGGVGWKIGETGRGARPPKEPGLQLVRFRCPSSDRPAWKEAEYRGGQAGPKGRPAGYRPRYPVAARAGGCEAVARV
jgi:hypothetical protein